MAAILFPVFTQARAKARQISCLSNVKNLSLAVLMYVDDYDGKFPLATPSYASVYTGVQWPCNVAKYIGAPEILHCPADGNMSPSAGPCLSYFVEGETCLGGPGDEYASGYWSDLGGMFTCYGRPEASIPEPGNTIMMGCASLDPAVENLSNGTGVWSVRSIDFATTLYGRRIACNIATVCNADPADKHDSGIIIHNGGSNYGFADGHAKWLKIEKAYYPVNLFAVVQPNPGGLDPFGNLAASSYGFNPTADF